MIRCHENNYSCPITTNLQSHKQTFAFYIGEAEINATGVTVYVPVSYNVLYLGINGIDQSL
jgi:hypothetical protein